MREEGEEAVEVAFDGEIQAPPPVNPGLPDALSLVVLLGTQRGVAEVLEQERDAAIHRLLDSWRSSRIVVEEALGIEGPHATAFSISSSLGAAN